MASLALLLELEVVSSFRKWEANKPAVFDFLFYMVPLSRHDLIGVLLVVLKKESL
jgi:hypothetical protein